MKKNWYQMEGSKLKEFITIMHIPYTMMCISFLTMGFAISGIRDYGLYILTFISYFLGLGISSHCFDQLTGMGSRYVEKLKDDDLIFIGIFSLVISILIGIISMIDYKLWNLIWLIPIQSFFVFSYPLAKTFRGKFHSDFWFSISFGAIPVIIGNYVNTGGFDVMVFVFASFCVIISYIEILLSRHSRYMRKEYRSKFSNDNALYNNIIYPQYIYRPEKALKMLCIMSYLLAVIMVLK